LVRQSGVNRAPNQPRLPGFHLINCSQDLFGPGPHGCALSQVHPTNRAGVINQEFGGTGDVAALRPSAMMQKIIPANHFGLGIAKQRVGKSQFGGMLSAYFWRVDADSYNTNAACGKIGKSLLETPQLGVTQ
jgi:hypothetical protein